VRLVGRAALLATALAFVSIDAVAAAPPVRPTPVVRSMARLPACAYADDATDRATYSQWTTTLLDTTYRLPSSYHPVDLVSTGLSGGGSIRRVAFTDLRVMERAARSAGARLAVQSSFRSYSNQVATFNRWVRKDGRAAALRKSARPGHSEHQLGTTIDFRSYGGGAPWTYTDWSTTKPGAWMKANAWKYGWVMTYPKGKAAVTCYDYEPWHFRYFGRATARLIHDSGLTSRQWIWDRFRG
jgi:D-alanyl-D-alanine carboxypeptidase